MKRYLAPLLFCVLVSAAEPLPRLRVSDNHRFLATEKGAPFFYLGDTAWELFHRLNREETERYLADRARKGFTVIEAVALAEFGGLTQPNRYDHLPLKDNDPTQPLEPYFEHVDWVVNKAGSLGLYVGLLPTWGDKVNKKWGQGPEIFTPENARIYGEWLGRRYKNAAGSYAMIYTPVAQPFTVRMDKVSGGKVKAWWFNPRDGTAKAIGEFPNTGEREFVAPESDWVLVLDDATQKFPPPGSR